MERDWCLRRQTAQGMKATTTIFNVPPLRTSKLVPGLRKTKFDVRDCSRRVGLLEGNDQLLRVVPVTEVQRFAEQFSEQSHNHAQSAVRQWVRESMKTRPAWLGMPRWSIPWSICSSDCQAQPT